MPIIEDIPEFEIDYIPHFFPERLLQTLQRWGGTVARDQAVVYAHPDTCVKILHHYLLTTEQARDADEGGFDLVDYYLFEDPTIAVDKMRVVRWDVAKKPPQMIV